MIWLWRETSSGTGYRYRTDTLGRQTAMFWDVSFPQVCWERMDEGLVLWQPHSAEQEGRWGTQVGKGHDYNY